MPKTPTLPLAAPVDFAVQHRTQRDRIFDRLGDLDWHHFSELHHVGGIRYSARLLELKRLGYRIETRELPHRTGREYRLVSREPLTPKLKRVKVFLTLEDARRLCAGDLTKTAAVALDAAIKSYRQHAEKL